MAGSEDDFLGYTCKQLLNYGLNCLSLVEVGVVVYPDIKTVLLLMALLAAYTKLWAKSRLADWYCS
jgi:hypothetical protein